jgi:uncharacterized protein (DUF697 family)
MTDKVVSSTPPLPSRNGRARQEISEEEKKTNLPPVPVKLPPPPPIKSTSLPPPPDSKNISFNQLEEAAKKWVEQRRQVIQLMETMILKLNKIHTNSTYARMGGRTTSLVGFGVAAGGVLLAPVTLGLSLTAVLPGLAVGAGGAITSTGASVTEWALTKQHLKTIQEQVEIDTYYANEVIEKARVLGLHDPECDSKYLFLGYSYVTVIDFVYAVSGVKHKQIKDKEGLSDSTIKSGMVFGAKVLCSFNPIISVPLDLMLIADDMESIKKKEPSSLAEVLVPIVHDLKEQLNKAIGDDGTDDF